MGGEYSNPGPSQVVDGASVVGSKSGSTNWNGGVTTGTLADASIDFNDLIYLAQNADDYYDPSTGFKVVVLEVGGTFNTYDFNPGGQGEDNGKTLVIFNTSDKVILDKTSDGRQFGPSVIAPFSTVELKGDAGFIDGFVVAKNFATTGSNMSQLQIHGDHYEGPIVCKN